ncbi:hypothetical protein PLICRDRAFT_34976 [Plicaturopsis crispa FD-325 SS-3]|nr:hypothetical protein PLICRDRAFT_34976 [Plicaturopsis crispa FD-325 SS-3]
MYRGALSSAKSAFPSCARELRSPNNLLHRHYTQRAERTTKQIDKKREAPEKIPEKLGDHFINASIPYRTVRLLDAKTGERQELEALTDVLARIDEKKQFLELLTETPEPLVRIQDWKETREKFKALRKASKAKGQDTAVQKEIQMTWGVAGGDFDHKILKAREELEKGNRVHLAFAPKRGQPRPTQEEMQSRADMCVEMLADISKEYKPRDVQKFVTVISLQRLPKNK